MRHLLLKQIGVITGPSPRGCFVQVCLSKASNKRKFGEQRHFAYCGSLLIASEGLELSHLAGFVEDFLKWQAEVRFQLKALLPSAFVHMQSELLKWGRLPRRSSLFTGNQASPLPSLLMKPEPFSWLLSGLLSTGPKATCWSRWWSAREDGNTRIFKGWC